MENGKSLAGMSQIGALARCCVAVGAGAPLQQDTVDLGLLKYDEMIISITHCGVCASDIALLDDTYGAGGFPMTLGHEVAGLVESVGVGVFDFAVGDRVGVGPIRSSCGHCKQCLNGREVHCAEVQLVAAPHGQGGFADRIKISSQFAFHIPDIIRSDDAAALMCAGLTTFAPLKRLAKPGDRVGVLGIGGLGHLAVKFARAMGCAVTTFSLNPSREDAENHQLMGADTVIDVEDLQSLRTVTGTIDLLLSTASGDVPWRRLMHAIAPEGQVCMVGGSTEQIGLVPLNLIHHQRTISGSAAGSRRDMREMLDFAARNHIRPQTELLPMSRINDAIGRLRKGDVRYRFVLENDLAES